MKDGTRRFIPLNPVRKLVFVADTILSVQKADAPVVTLSVYPNPTAGRFTVRVETPRSGVGHLELYDLTGALVRDMGSREYAAGTTLVELSDKINALASGEYRLQLDLGGSTYHAPVVLSH